MYLSNMGFADILSFSNVTINNAIDIYFINKIGCEFYIKYYRYFKSIFP